MLGKNKDRNRDKCKEMKKGKVRKIFKQSWEDERRNKYKKINYNEESIEETDSMFLKN